MAGVGLIESLLTLNIIDEITETRGRGIRKLRGVANILSGVFLVWVAALCWDKALLMFLMVQDKTFRNFALALLLVMFWC
jgi:hypothetical protein